MFNYKHNKAYTIAVGGGILEALYCFFIAWLLPKLGEILGQGKSVLNPLLMLLTLVFSVALSGFLLFGYPIYLASQKQYSLAFSSVAVSLITLIVILLLVFVLSLSF